jgi:hypothetical protein
LPARFICGGSYQWRNGGGELSIGADGVTFDFRRWTPVFGRIPPITQRAGAVTFVRARLLPPGLNRGLVVRGGKGAVQVITWFGQYRRVRAALEAAGIAIEEKVSWLSCGARLAREESRHATGH